MKKIGITGGIGSGKSVVSKILMAMGYPVYLADPQAKRLMEADAGLKTALINILGPEIFTKDGVLDRPKMAAIIFSDTNALARVNQLVHQAVVNDFSLWCSKQAGNSVCFIEAAILFESGTSKLLDKVITVTAPLAIRIERIKLRDGFSNEEIYRRIANQMDDDERSKLSDFIIENDNKQALMPQIFGIFDQLKQ
jgi:dephospho-CoA kinase